MGKITLSGEFFKEEYTLVDNVFITEFLPHAPAAAVKVYLYGLYAARNPEASTDQENLCLTLDLSLAELKDAYDYLQEAGLLRYEDRDEMSVVLCSPKNSIKGYKLQPSKYADFNVCINALFPTRMPSVNEMREYYYLIEEYNIEPNALLQIAQYCVSTKSSTVRYPYILAVAKNFIREGALTVEAVDKKLAEIEDSTEKVKQVLRAMKNTSTPDADDKALYMSWINSLGFDHDAILTAATLLKRGNMNKLDAMMKTYAAADTLSAAEITSFEQKKAAMQRIIENVAKKLGARYGSYDYFIESYVTKWLQNGYTEKGLDLLALLALENGIRTIPAFNEFVEKYYRDGVVTDEDLREKLQEREVETENVVKILHTLGSNRNVNDRDRENYRIWTINWNFTPEAVLAAAEKVKAVSSSTASLNGFLAKCKSAGKFTPDEIATVEVASTSDRNNEKGKLERSTVTEESIEKLKNNLDNYDDID